MNMNATYRVEVVPCPHDPELFRWQIVANGTPIDCPGFAYATAWSAEEAGRVALHWHLALGKGALNADRARRDQPVAERNDR